MERKNAAEVSTRFRPRQSAFVSQDSMLLVQNARPAGIRFASQEIEIVLANEELGGVQWIDRAA